MVPNVGTTDRILRLIIGVVAIAMGIIYDTWWGWIGILPIITAIIGWCPIYAPLHISTCAIKHEK
jgi:hypothetical protein